MHDVYEEIGETICLGLNFFHAFTGYDSTCSFYRKTKSTWYETWMTCPMWCDITNAFQKLSWMPSDDVVLQTLPVIENFVSFANYYNSKSQNVKELNELRFELFQSSSNEAKSTLRDLPPSSRALEFHVRINAFQAGWIWGNTFDTDDLSIATALGLDCDGTSTLYKMGG